MRGIRVGNFLLDKDILITIVWFITILQNQQAVACFVMTDAWNSSKGDEIHLG